MGALMAASLTSMQTALADSPWSVSANIGAVSNYIWRGVTQTQDGAAVQGGLDVAHESGFSAGAWISNIDWGTPDPNYELDLYLGYSYAVNDDLSFDLTGIYYAYPDGRDSDFAEIGGSATWKWFTLGLAYTVYGQNDGGLFDNGDWYYFGGFEYGDLPFGLTFSARGGYYDFRYGGKPSADYWNYGASISKEAGDFGTFSLNWDQNDGNPDSAGGYDNDPKFWVGWLKEF
jgi:uncharacterized protein (TIGR02001 family)